MLFFKIVVCIFVIRAISGDSPNFRVLAPEIVCHNNDESHIKPLDQTVVTIKTDAKELEFSWSVRWTPLVQPTQRLTLLLWRTARALEVMLNAPQLEPFVYVIDNEELLAGVEYVFNVTASEPGSNDTTSKSFQIDNVKGDKKLLIEGRIGKFSLLLIAVEEIYTDMEYVVEAEVTTCTPTQDYYFVWRVESTSVAPFKVNASGARLEIPPYSLKAGASYHVTCSVYSNNHDFVTQTSLPLRILYRGLGLRLNLDELIVTVNKGFAIEAVVTNHDYYDEIPQFEWSCQYENAPCEGFSSIDSKALSLPDGLPNLGLYEITMKAKISDQQASGDVTLKVVEATLPSIQVKPLSRLNNKQSIITLVANASDVTPSCTLTWYFASTEYLETNSSKCEDCQHGEPLSESVTIISLEENFLNQLTDFTNETEWRLVTAEIEAAAGRARFVAKCGCSLTFSCDTEGVAYADLSFELNYPPEVAEVKISPDTGIAMETEFRISTLEATDEDRPLRYSFYCRLGVNNTLLLGSNLEHLAVKTFLPYVDATGTEVWVEVCDSFGACSKSGLLRVNVDPGEGRTLDALMETLRGYVARCEILLLERLAKSAITTYINANQHAELSKFTTTLRETFLHQASNCTENFYQTLLEYI